MLPVLSATSRSRVALGSEGRKSALNQTSASVAVGLAAALWGTTGTVAYLLSDAVSAFLIGAITMGVGGVLLAAIAGRAALQLWRDSAERPVVWLSAAAVVAYPLAFYSGMDLAGVAVGNIVALGTGPLVGAVFEWVLDGRRPATAWWWALGFGLAGVVSLSLSDTQLTSASPEHFGWGVALAVMAGVAYGGFSYGLSRLIRNGHRPVAATGAVFGLGSIPLVIVAVTGVVLMPMPAGAVWGLGYLVIGPMVLSYLLYSRGLLVLPASRALVIALIEPAVATLLAVMVVGERFGSLGAFGIAAIVVSVWLASRFRSLRDNAGSA